MKRQLTSNSTLRRQLQRMQQAVIPGAGINSDRLKAKRRKQMLAGKLGRVAQKTAAEAVFAILPDYAKENYKSSPVALQTAVDSYLNNSYGKELTENA